MNMTVTVTKEQLALRPGQRAMIAARLVTARQWFHKQDGDVTCRMAAKALSVGPTSVTRARTVLLHCSPEIIKLCDDGLMGVNKAISAFNATRPPQAPKKYTDKNLAHYERQRQEALVWKHVRDAILALTSLPLPADVVPVARKMNRRHNTVLPKLPRALAWLKEFADVCNGEAPLEEDAGREAAAGRGEV